MDYETLRYEQDEHVVTLTYDRPDQHNAISREMAGELHHAWRRFRDDDSAFVLIRIAAENAEFGALERRWNIVGGDGMTVRLPLVVGFAKAMELIITGRRIDVHEAERIGLVNEVVPRGGALERAQELAREIAALPQGAIRTDKESVMRGVGRTLEERLRIEAELTLSMFMRRDSHTIGAGAFKRGERPVWPHHGL